MVGTPIVVNATSGRRPPATSVPAGTQLSASFIARTHGRQACRDGRFDRRRRPLGPPQPASDPLRTWPDFSPMLVTGEDQTIDGRVWRPVLTLDGQTGWAASEFLVPAPVLGVRRAGRSSRRLAHVRSADRHPRGLPGLVTRARRELLPGHLTAASHAGIRMDCIIESPLSQPRPPCAREGSKGSHCPLARTGAGASSEPDHAGSHLTHC